MITDNPPQTTSDLMAKNVIDQSLVKQLIDNVQAKLAEFKSEAHLLGRTIPEAAALICAGDQHFVQSIYNRMQILPLGDHVSAGTSGIFVKLLCTISPRNKKLEELEAAERQVKRLKDELAALPAD